MYDSDGEGDGPETFGIMVYGDSDVTISGNTIVDFSRGGIGVNGDYGPYPDPIGVVEGNDITGHDESSIQTGWWAENGIQIGWEATGAVNDNTVKYCRVNNDYWGASGILIYSACDEVLRNYVRDCDLGIALYYNTDGEVVFNEATENDWGMDIFLCTGVVIHHNDVYKNEKHGMEITYSDDIGIHHNNVDENGYEGIRVKGCDFSNIHHNKVNDNGRYGIIVDSYAGYYWYFDGTSWNYLYATDNSDDNIIHQNTAAYNEYNYYDGPSGTNNQWHHNIDIVDI